MSGMRWLTDGADVRLQQAAARNAWRAFIRFCLELEHGQIERLSIQDGVPVLAETARKKVKFS